MQRISTALLVASLLAGCGAASSGGANAPEPRATPGEEAEPEATPVSPTEELRQLYGWVREASRGTDGAPAALRRLTETTYHDEDVENTRALCVQALSEGELRPRSSSAARPPMMASHCVPALMIQARLHNLLPAPTGQPVDVSLDGELAEGDAIVPDDRSFYDDYEVVLERGWVIEVSMESEEFDTYLWLVGPDGRSVVQNDDTGTPSRGDTDSYFRVPVVETGPHYVRANSYDSSGRGAYRLRVRAGPMPLIP